VARWLKVLIIMCAAGVLLLAAAVGGLVWWFNANKDRLRAQGDTVKAEAKAFARGKSSETCITEALARQARASGFVQETLANVFLESCLETAARDPALCADVPRESEIMATVGWRSRACAQRGKDGDQACGRLMGAVQQVCNPP
jgi:hypothetical protein